MLYFNDLIEKIGIDPAEVNIARHTPYETKFKRVMPWIASERPDLFDFYQSTQSPDKERMFRNRQYLASFLGLDSKATIFVGFYRLLSEKEITRDEFWQFPEAIEMKALGFRGFHEQEKRESCAQFTFEVVPDFLIFGGKLKIEWTGGTRSWVRNAANADFEILSLSEENLLCAQIPSWDEVVLSFAELLTLPSEWYIRMKEWRGIYLITDVSDGKQYVGSATGDDNLYQRWLEYSKTGHGGNKLLHNRSPENFSFSILELTSQNTHREDVLNLENKWKARLHTKQFGLNAN